MDLIYTSSKDAGAQIKNDVWRTVEVFYQKVLFVRSLNATFIALIPKKKGWLRQKISGLSA